MGGEDRGSHLSNTGHCTRRLERDMPREERSQYGKISVLKEALTSGETNRQGGVRVSWSTESAGSNRDTKSQEETSSTGE